MIYRFTIISDEFDDFVREIQIDPEATFYDFHEAILKMCIRDRFDIRIIQDLKSKTLFRIPGFDSIIFPFQHADNRMCERIVACQYLSLIHI